MRKLETCTKQMVEKVAALEQENQILEEKLKLALFRQFGRANGLSGTGSTYYLKAKKAMRPRWKRRKNRLSL
jgi:hypothetical protein